MEFTEKLLRLTDGENKAKLAKSAGLPGTAISNYITKRQMPRADKAFILSRALNVPLEWLVDDSQDWPPPEPPQKLDAGSLSDDELMFEISRRHRIDLIRFIEQLDRVERIDWNGVRTKLRSMDKNEPFPAEVIEIASPAIALYFLGDHVAGRFNPEYYAAQRHLRMPGHNRPVADFDSLTLIQRWIALMENEAYREVLVQLLPIIPEEHRANFKKVQLRNASFYGGPRNIPADLPNVSQKHSRKGRQ